MLETILVATDGSNCAGRAVELAGHLAARCDAKLIVLHVYPAEVPEELRHMVEAEHLAPATTAAPPRRPMANPFSAEPNAVSGAGASVPMRDALVAIGRQILSGAQASARRAGAAEVVTTTADGDPTRAILDCAMREKADLIVMGRRGLSDLQGLLMGSVSHKVSHLADCACLTVK